MITSRLFPKPNNGFNGDGDYSREKQTDIVATVEDLAAGWIDLQGTREFSPLLWVKYKQRGAILSLQPGVKCTRSQQSRCRWLNDCDSRSLHTSACQRNSHHDLLPQRHTQTSRQAHGSRAVSCGTGRWFKWVVC
jgi:hypothetical protein